MILIVQIYFFPQPSAAIKIKDGGQNFRYEKTEHSFAKLTPALRARRWLEANIQTVTGRRPWQP